MRRLQMRKTFRLLQAVALVSAVTSTSVLAECTRKPRELNFENSPNTVYLSDGQYTEVIFPEASLEGANPEKPEDLIVSRTRIPSKLSFSTESDTYHGLFTVHGTSGRTYLIKFLARKGCADSIVKMVKPSTESVRATVSAPGTSASQVKKGLIDYLIDHPDADDLPTYYEQRDFEGPRESRLVFEQGSIKAFMHQQFLGTRYVGTILEVINTGRSAIRLDIQNIDYSDPTIVETFGRIREITMNPFDFVLGPSPEYVSEIYGSTHRGFIYIVSQKEDDRG